MTEPSSTIGIYSPAFNKPEFRTRMNYLLSFIGQRCSDLQFVLLKEADCASVDYKIFYADKNSGMGDMFIPYTGFLIKNTATFTYAGQGENAVLFPVGDKFDFFAAIFHCLMRTEEAGATAFDSHGRFRHTDSWHYAAECLDYPIVDIWIDDYLRKLKLNVDFQLNYKMRIIPTFDIDYPWLRKHLKPMRRFKRFIKAGLTANVEAMKGLLTGSGEDPYFTFDSIIGILDKHKLRGIFFLLLGGRTSMDIQNVIKDNKEFTDLLNLLSDGQRLGIHPSYNSSRNTETLKEELSIFKYFLGHDATYSRQHFLRILYPETIKTLAKNGIHHEYSMAYAGREGWRSGTSYPYNWYDIHSEKPMRIVIHPLQFMDMTMYSYRQKSPEESGVIIDRMKEKVLRYGGEFVILWHNSFFHKKSAKWWEIFDESLQQ